MTEGQTETMPICRVLPYREADGATNMAIDEAMLNQVAIDPSAALFRFYRWSEPTLSLGYFQSYSEALSDPRWHDVPIVRRPTGGGAIWHDCELTYAVVVPRNHPIAASSLTLYRAVHLHFAQILTRGGTKATRRGENDLRPDLTRPFLCFSDRDPNDIVIDSHKVVGSAQRRRKGAILQHGSILFHRAAKTPELLGAADLGYVLSATLGEFAENLPDGVLADLGYSIEHTDWPASVLLVAQSLENEVYRNLDWTRRR